MGGDGWESTERSRILGEVQRGGITGGTEAEPAGAAGIAARSTSLKERDGVPPPDFPEGGVSRPQRWALLRPEAITGEGLDAGREGGEVATGLGMRAGVGLVEAVMAPRRVGGREGSILPKIELMCYK